MGVLSVVLQGLGIVIIVLAVLVAGIPLTDPVYSIPIGIGLAIGGLLIVGIGAIIDLLNDIRRH